jgi:hypothetical protein
MDDNTVARLFDKIDSVRKDVSDKMDGMKSDVSCKLDNMQGDITDIKVNVALNNSAAQEKFKAHETTHKRLWALILLILTAIVGLSINAIVYFPKQNNPSIKSIPLTPKTP